MLTPQHKHLLAEDSGCGLALYALAERQRLLGQAFAVIEVARHCGPSRPKNDDKVDCEGPVSLLSPSTKLVINPIGRHDLSRLEQSVCTRPEFLVQQFCIV